MTINEKLVWQEINRGVQAHKAGNRTRAWLHFQAAVREDAQNVTALLWLAYLATDHDKRVFLLNRILEVDPDNERARAGLAWARQQTPQPEDEIALEADNSESQTTPDAVAALRQKLNTRSVTAELRQQALKGTIAQRARRRISPFLLLLALSGALTGATFFSPL